MHKIIFIFLTLFAWTTLQALPFTKIYGTVNVKESGLPLAGADVFLMGTKNGVSTDANGYFEIKVPAAGKYDIAVHCTGYRIQTKKNILLMAEKAAVLHFEMEKEILETSAIVVEGQKESSLSLMLPARMERIQLKFKRQTQNLDLAQMLSSGNSMFIKSYGTAGQLQTIALRGMSAEQTQVLLDGISLNNMQLGSADISAYNSSDLESVDIYRGGSPLFGGSGAVGGTVNLHTVQPGAEPAFSLHTEMASFRNLKAGFAIDLPAVRLRQRLDYSGHSGKNNYTTIQNGIKTELQNRDFSRWNLGYRNRIPVLPGLMFSSVFRAYKSEAGAPKAFINTQTEEANKARLKNKNTLAALKMKYQGSLGGISLQTYSRNEWMEYRDSAFLLNGQPLHSIHFNQEKGLLLRGRYLPFPALLLLSGAEGSLQKINSSAAGSHRRTRTAFYISAGWQVFGDQASKSKLVLNGSLRFENDSSFGNISLPGLGLTFNCQKFQLYSSVGKNYRAPSFNDLFWVPGGNPDLKPEQSFNMEAGTRYKSTFDSATVTLSAGLYQNRVSNQIKWLPENGLWKPYNILEVDSRGVEIEGSVAHKNGLHRLWFNYRYGLAKKAAKEFDGDRTIGHRLPLIPAEQWNAGLQSGWKNIRSGVQISGVGFRYKSIQNDAEQILPSYQVWRIWSSVHFNMAGQKAAFSASVENLLDKRYEVMPGYPMPPRSFRLGLSLVP